MPYDEAFEDLVAELVGIWVHHDRTRKEHETFVDDLRRSGPSRWEDVLDFAEWDGDVDFSATRLPSYILKFFARYEEAHGDAVADHENRAARSATLLSSAWVGFQRLCDVEGVPTEVALPVPLLRKRLDAAAVDNPCTAEEAAVVFEALQRHLETLRV